MVVMSVGGQGTHRELQLGSPLDAVGAEQAVGMAVDERGPHHVGQGSTAKAWAPAPVASPGKSPELGLVGASAKTQRSEAVAWGMERSAGRWMDRNSTEVDSARCVGQPKSLRGGVKIVQKPYRRFSRHSGKTP